MEIPDILMSAEISPKKMHLSKDEEENKLDLILSEVKALRSQVEKGCISVQKLKMQLKKVKQTLMTVIRVRC